MINLLALMKSKLGACRAREEPKDFHDLLFLVSRYAEEISGFRGELEGEARERFVRGFEGGSVGMGGGNGNKIRRVKWILGVP